MQFLRADTITEVTIGPAVAVGDGFTPVTSLDGSLADSFEVIKHGATATTTIAGTLSAIVGADGYYALDLSATDTDTEGRLTVLVTDTSLIRPIRHEFQVVSAIVYDSLFAAGAIGVDDLPTVGEMDIAHALLATPSQVATEVSNALTVDPLVSGKTITDAISIIASAAAGEISGAGTGNEVCADMSGVTKITYTVDASGNRTNVAYVP